MHTVSRLLLILLAILGVGSLGYYAYTLTSETLTLPFAGSESQYGDTLSLVVSPPSFHFGHTSDVLIDPLAVRSSLLFDGASVTIGTGAYDVAIGPAYVKIQKRDIEKKETHTLILSADLYNKNKTTAYRLPKDIVLTLTDAPSNISLFPKGDPRDQIYDISLYGLGEYTPDQILYYAHYEPTATCDISTWGAPQPYLPEQGYTPKGMPIVSSEAPPSLSILLSPWILREIRPVTILPVSKDGQKWISQIKLPYDLSKTRVCIIAGVAGQFQNLVDRNIGPFTLTGGVVASLSPEHEMKSQVEFRFTQDIYSDIGVLYSAEYISHRRDAKIAFLRALDISPHVDVTPEDLILTPDRALLSLPMKEGERYTFSLRDITDIYGRKGSLEYTTILKSEPFLSLRLATQKQIYTLTDMIDAKLYAILPLAKSYTLKLCETKLETYSRIERLLSDTSRVSLSEFKSLMSDTRDMSNCREKDIVLSASGYVSPFRIDDFFLGGEKKIGLYVLSLASPGDGEKYVKPIVPIIFSIVDTHITLKVDASGKMMVLATDISTGKPLPDQKITLMRNISRTHTEKWDPNTGKTDKLYLPLTTQSFATGIIIGKTDGGGYLDASVATLPGIDGYDAGPYGLTFESWWNYEGRYDSFLVESRSEGRLGYLVSTWNDGITGYNFGIKDSDYSYETRPEFTSYIHTDRRLYLPGEKVYLHAIIRQNSTSLTPPTDTSFDLVITDPMGREMKRATIKPNEYGSVATELTLAKDASLGSYGISLVSTNSAEYVQNGYSNFQVEVFKNPTFTATVELKSPDLEKDTLRDLRKVPNTDPYTPWYNDIYTGKFTIEGIVKAKYYNGADIRNTPFTYRVYRSQYYPSDYWGECFWGCYYEPQLEPYTAGSGSIDSDGYGIVRIPIDYTSYYSDYTYTVEVTIRDVLTGEEVTTPGSLIVKLPEIYKSFAPENPLIFTPKKKILMPGESLTGEVKPSYGKWDTSLALKYRYEIIYREYSEALVDDIRAGTLRITTPTDRVVASGSITKAEISDRMIGMKPGEYHVRTSPVVATGEAPESSISDTVFYISGDVSMSRDSTLRVIPERTIYKAGETARVMIQVPFTGSYLLITKEKGGVIDHEYVYLTGNTLTREYKIDDTMMPNAYIGVVALRPGERSEKSRTYAVGYGEIVTDIAGKKALLTITSDKSTYKNRDPVNVDLTLTDRSGNPLEGEVTLMVVDESLIRLLGNIDLDIIPKFYQKYPFTVKTALSAIGIERGRYLSRKGSNGGGGDKGGGGVQISSRTLFQNTAYYAPSIRTDLSGKARVTFTLPDNITDYRIITIANTRDSKFAVAEKTIEVRKDYVLESAAPTILRSGDTFTLTASAFNNTKRVTPVDVFLTIGTGSGKIEKKGSLTLDAMDRKAIDFSLTTPASWKDTVSYTIELRDKNTVLDSITRNILLPVFPIVSQKIRSFELFTGSTLTHILPKSPLANMDPSLSEVDIALSSNFAPQIAQGISSLLIYPYGCIEQTIASTLPNRIAISLASTLSLPLDMTKAKEYTRVGLAKILRMQHYSGGWTYWEGSDEANAHITPYVLRSLLRFQSLGESIPQEVFTNGLSYIISNDVQYASSPDDAAEAAWTLAALRDERALMWWSRIDTKRLSRHGYVAYAYAAQKLGKYTPDIEKRLYQMLEKNDDSWYWDISADRAIVAQLLLERRDRDKSLRIIDPLIRELDLTSYYVSTQTKIQTLLVLIDTTETSARLTKGEAIALRSDGLISDLALSLTNPSSSLKTTREKIGASYSLKRDTSSAPLYLTTMISDRPRDMTTLASYGTGGVSITRSFEQIDESRGVDDKGDFILRTPVKDGVFSRGKLYRVILTAALPPGTSRNFSLEDFFPGGWRSINGIFQTEKSSLGDTGKSWWSYIESRSDRLLAHRDYVSGDERSLEYSYYIRPESVGEYLLPPATAYLMYRPEIHAYTKYERVRVIDSSK